MLVITIYQNMYPLSDIYRLEFTHGSPPYRNYFFTVASADDVNPSTSSTVTQGCPAHNHKTMQINFYCLLLIKSI